MISSAGYRVPLRGLSDDQSLYSGTQVHMACNLYQLYICLGIGP
jgi:hypothetical protein